MTNLDPSAALRSDAEKMMRYDANKRSALIAYILWFFLGSFGAHRFYLGRIGSAVVMLLLMLASLLLSLIFIGYLGLAVVAIWVLIDAFLIPGMTSDYNNRLINSL